MGKGTKFIVVIFAILIVGLGIFFSFKLDLLDPLIAKLGIDRNGRREEIPAGKPPQGCQYRGKRLVCEYYKPLPLKYYMKREIAYNLGRKGKIFTFGSIPPILILGIEDFIYREGYIEGKKAAMKDINKHYPTLLGFGGALIGGFIPGGLVACSLGLPSSIPQDRISQIEEQEEKSVEYNEGYRDGYLARIKKAWNEKCWNGVWTATFIGMIIIWLSIT